MKKFFLAAVAISALCSSCETTDDTLLSETNYKSLNAQKTKGLTNTDYETYRNVVENFVYNSDQSYIDNVVSFEKHVNRTLKSDTQANTYESINLEQLKMLLEKHENIIDELHYSAEFKEYLYHIVHKNNVVDFQLKDEKENRLMYTLFKVHNDNKGNGNDDKLNKRRTIAFAYGNQYSFKQAVLYAGAIELKTKIN
ncbi:hypothetical protein SAMN05421741_11335 [Paenimyroides ummariense]|uniref:Uncharacterized protein n=1 Tax=Paenimyroides ummariense TaxID=913024 RepID=A0A1I5CRN6_9FLAO|nr:hypothetical protein [Paenimyroides ummariense]SFN89669.1 hypothetical protein SAMN05421741_11335 [Paenimyroides ummariense]